MGGDGVALHAGRLKFSTLVITVSLICFSHLKVITPAAQLNAIIAKRLGFLHNGIKWKVGPLAGKKCNGSAHGIE
jgi:hypothetical protein